VQGDPFRRSLEEYPLAAIIFDSASQAKLNGLQEQLELRGLKGHTVGHLLPASLYQELVQVWAKAHFTDREER
jgi:hypothetical protein